MPRAQRLCSRHLSAHLLTFFLGGSAPAPAFASRCFRAVAPTSAARSMALEPGISFVRLTAFVCFAQLRGQAGPLARLVLEVGRTLYIPEGKPARCSELSLLLKKVRHFHTGQVRGGFLFLGNFGLGIL